MFSIFKKKTVIPHVRLTGVIGSAGKFKQGMDLAGQQEILKKAFSLKKIKHVAISINSPGGSPVQSHLIYSYIRQLADKKKIKVLIFAEDVAASGGYLISCAGDEIYANSSSIIGSIGVISASFGFKELIKKIGIERRVYSEGKNKGLLDQFLPEKKEDIDQIKTIQTDLHGQFINWVKKRRGKRLKAKDTELFNAGIWSGVKSKELGLIDGIGDYYTIMKSTFGEDIKFKDFSKKTSWIKQRFFSSKINCYNETSVVNAFIDSVEEKIIWSKYGF